MVYILQTIFNTVVGAYMAVVQALIQEGPRRSFYRLYYYASDLMNLTFASFSFGSGKDTLQALFWTLPPILGWLMLLWRTLPESAKRKFKEAGRLVGSTVFDVAAALSPFGRILRMYYRYMYVHKMPMAPSQFGYRKAGRLTFHKDVCSGETRCVLKYSRVDEQGKLHPYLYEHVKMSSLESVMPTEDLRPEPFPATDFLLGVAIDGKFDPRSQGVRVDAPTNASRSGEYIISCQHFFEAYGVRPGSLEKLQEISIRNANNGNTVHLKDHWKSCEYFPHPHYIQGTGTDICALKVPQSVWCSLQIKSMKYPTGFSNRSGGQLKIPVWDLNSSSPHASYGTMLHANEKDKKNGRLPHSSSTWKGCSGGPGRIKIQNVDKCVGLQVAGFDENDPRTCNYMVGYHDMMWFFKHLGFVKLPQLTDWNKPYAKLPPSPPPSGFSQVEYKSDGGEIQYDRYGDPIGGVQRRVIEKLEDDFERQKDERREREQDQDDDDRDLSDEEANDWTEKAADDWDDYMYEDEHRGSAPPTRHQLKSQVERQVAAGARRAAAALDRANWNTESAPSASSTLENLKAPSDVPSKTRQPALKRSLTIKGSKPRVSAEELVRHRERLSSTVSGSPPLMVNHVADPDFPGWAKSDITLAGYEAVMLKGIPQGWYFDHDTAQWWTRIAKDGNAIQGTDTPQAGPPSEDTQLEPIPECVGGAGLHAAVAGVGAGVGVVAGLVGGAMAVKAAQHIPSIPCAVARALVAPGEENSQPAREMLEWAQGQPSTALDPCRSPSLGGLCDSSPEVSDDEEESSDEEEEDPEGVPDGSLETNNVPDQPPGPSPDVLADSLTIQADQVPLEPSPPEPPLIQRVYSDLVASKEARELAKAQVQKSKATSESSYKTRWTGWPQASGAPRSFGPVLAASAAQLAQEARSEASTTVPRPKPGNRSPVHGKSSARNHARQEARREAQKRRRAENRNTESAPLFGKDDLKNSVQCIGPKGPGLEDTQSAWTSRFNEPGTAKPKYKGTLHMGYHWNGEDIGPDHPHYGCWTPNRKGMYLVDKNGDFKYDENGERLRATPGSPVSETAWRIRTRMPAGEIINQKNPEKWNLDGWSPQELLASPEFKLIRDYYNSAEFKKYEHSRVISTNEKGEAMARIVGTFTGSNSGKPRKRMKTTQEMIDKCAKHGLALGHWTIPAGDAEELEGSLITQLNRTTCRGPMYTDNQGRMRGIGHATRKKAMDKMINKYCVHAQTFRAHFLDVFTGVDQVVDSLDGTKSAGWSSLYRTGQKSTWQTCSGKETLANLTKMRMILRLAWGKEAMDAMTPLELYENCLSDPRWAHLKFEPHDEGKSNEGRWRIIWAVSILDSMVTAMTSRHQDKTDKRIYQEGEYPTYHSIGMGHHDSGNEDFTKTLERIIEASLSPECGHTIDDHAIQDEDARGWDLSVQRWWLYRDAHRRCAQYQGPCRSVFEELQWCESVTGSAHMLCYGNKVVEILKAGITPSGSITTSTQNSFNRSDNAVMCGAEDACSNGDDLVACGMDPRVVAEEMGHNSKGMNYAKRSGPIKFTSHEYKKVAGRWQVRYLNMAKMVAKVLLSAKLPTREQLCGCLFVIRNSEEQTKQFRDIANEFAWPIDGCQPLEVAPEEDY